MPVPSKMADLQTLAASNSPAGSDAIGNSLDDYMRAGFAILRSTNANSSASIASASTTDIGSSDGEAVTVTGTATITSFGTTPSGIVREVTFSGACTITNSSAIQLNPSTNYVTVAGDTMIFRSLGGGNWKQVTQASLKYTPVNRAGDTMTGALQLSLNTNNGAVVRVGNSNNGNNAASGYYFGNDVDASFAAFITKNSTGNATFGGGSSLNIVQNQNAPMTFYTNGLKRATIAASGAFESQGGFKPTGDDGVPSNTGGASFFIGGFSSPVAGRTAFGDGTGWRYLWSSRNGSYTDVMTLTDSGALSTTTSVSSPLVTQTSDARLKYIDGDFQPRDLSEIRIADYRWKSTGKRAVSPIAQEVQERAPEYVHEDHDGILSVDKAALALERVAFLEGVFKRAGLWP